ncbi:cell division protein FtsQ [Sodalis endosymbiont of Henestaris halophilus]|uniref:cell division protein FtsQ n=1 Tax=Sodalis endosymbiont of Henestaris halophilus TaxID=1929246 RepID=UPI000BBF8403|nr:cell division protein FtsQ [Sodalis endosymbiont of Henestaris halophilus]SNC58989.1 Cell division protein FtsQ [Sodalis endosymbiont of Henestaris halophilus]
MSQAEINVRNRKTDKDAAYRSIGHQLSRLICLLIMFSIIACSGFIAVVWIKNVYRLPLSRLVVTGVRHYTTNNDIRQAIIELGIPNTFGTQDVSIIQHQIECMPWIKQVSVRKQWPNELKIHVEEYMPVARWNDLHLLDNSGKVFYVPEARLGNQTMPMLYGPEGSEQNVLAGYRKINDILISAKIQLKAVNMSSRHAWQLTLRDNTQLELGRDDQVKRLQRFIGIRPVLFQQAFNDNKRINYVDLRYDSGMAVGWITGTYIEPKNSK